jgi:hypothetical protein
MDSRSILFTLLLSSACVAAEPRSKPASAPPTNATVRGRIVWLAEALHRRWGVEIDADAAHAQIALETKSGELLAIVKDKRGRGFYVDPQLLKFDYELVVRRFPGTADVQVIRVYTIRKGKKYELDYWCDICAIPMYELKACECCQGPTRLRERLVGPAD